MTDPIRAALERLIARLDETTDPNGPVPAWSDSFYAARAALARPAPPAEGEVAELVRWLRSRAGIPASPDFPAVAVMLNRAADLLEQLSAAAPPPAPVSERPWEREGWCDGAGKCWWGRSADEYCNHDWHYATRAEVEEFCSDAMPQVSLPAYSLPLPTPSENV